MHVNWHSIYESSALHDCKTKELEEMVSTPACDTLKDLHVIFKDHVHKKLLAKKGAPGSGLPIWRKQSTWNQAVRFEEGWGIVTEGVTPLARVQVQVA